ncbi:MAG: helix-turn-helix transcriptional regulator [Candidatus Margulisbacteria bacterium]|nr:helix-turn-helix transcriptional regulator [Candidatus Margulisiibacteriota bacterium]
MGFYLPKLINVNLAKSTHLNAFYDNTNIPAVVRNIRWENDLSLKDFASILGLTQYRLNGIEHGSRLPSSENIATLEKNFNLKFSWPDIGVNRLLSWYEVNTFIARNFSTEKLKDRDSLYHFSERMRFGTREDVYMKYLEKYLEEIKIKNPQITLAEIEKLTAKWQEPLTIYGGCREIQNVPRGLVHELALPHGASDGLIIDVAADNGRGMVLINFKTKKDTASQEGIGGHKKSGLTFRENMIEEFLEEVFGLPEKKDNISFMPDEQKMYNNIKEKYETLVRQNFFYTGSQTTNANFNNIDNQINIHVSDLYVLRLPASQIPSALNSEASKGHQWVTFAEAEQIAHTADGFFFGILWNNLVRAAGGINGVLGFVTGLRK